MMSKNLNKTTKLMMGLTLMGCLTAASAQNWPQSEQAYHSTAQSPQWIERAPAPAPMMPRGYAQGMQQAPYQGYSNGYGNGYGYGYAPNYNFPNPMPYYMPQMNMTQPPVMRQAPFNAYNNGNYAGPMNNFTRPMNQFFNGQNGFYPQNNWGNNGWPTMDNWSMPNMNNMNMPSMPDFDMPTMNFDMPNMNNMPFMGNGSNAPWNNMPFGN